MNPLSLVEIESEMRNLMGWTYSPQKKCISKEFSFKSFTQTFALMTQVAMYAESHNHHPEWRNVYTKLWIELSTHDASGVTRKDLELAAFINEKAWEVR
jgi:4a-hydroxytetrahydrobiopterin dehydratase